MSGDNHGNTKDISNISTVVGYTNSNNINPSGGSSSQSQMPEPSQKRQTEQNQFHDQSPSFEGNKGYSGCIIENAINIILQSVQEGTILKQQAEDFAGMLNLKC